MIDNISFKNAASSTVKRTSRSISNYISEHPFRALLRTSALVGATISPLCAAGIGIWAGFKCFDKIDVFPDGAKNPLMTRVKNILWTGSAVGLVLTSGLGMSLIVRSNLEQSDRAYSAAVAGAAQELADSDVGTVVAERGRARYISPWRWGILYKEKIITGTVSDRSGKYFTVDYNDNTRRSFVASRPCPNCQTSVTPLTQVSP